MKPVALGPAFKQMRARSGLSQRALAARLGIHQPQVAKAEQGHDALLSRIQAMAQALGCELMLVPYEQVAAIESALANDQTPSPSPLRNSEDASGDPTWNGLADSYRREWPDIDPNVFLVIAHVLRAAQLLQRGTRDLAARHGMNGGEALVLAALRRQGKPYEATMGQLRKQFWISLPGISKRVHQLERLGLVKRTDNPDDRRGALVRLTAKGLAVQEKQVQMPAPEFNAIRQMQSAERRCLAEMLQQLVNDLKASREHAGDPVLSPK